MHLHDRGGVVVFHKQYRKLERVLEWIEAISKDLIDRTRLLREGPGPYLHNFDGGWNLPNNEFVQHSGERIRY